MMKIFQLYLTIVVSLLLGKYESVKYIPCPMKTEKETRRLFVATCDTRIGFKEFNALRYWNVTGMSLRNDNVHMKNVCKGENWGKLGFLTKPLLYHRYIKSIMEKYPDDLSYIILMDSDTFWSAENNAKIWNKYDCARGNKPVVLSTEMSCWIGRYCVEDDLKRWYSKVIDSPSFSPYANSGVIMGTVKHVAKMLNYVIVNNATYFITYHKNKFDDQFAIADYAINVEPNDVALDYHQQISASCSIHAPGDPPDEGWPFVCKDVKTGDNAKSCHIYTNIMKRLGHFTVNKTTCLAGRKVWDKMPLQTEMESLAQDPIIWHGNGAGKQMYGDQGHKSFKCFLEKRGMTEADHVATYG